MADAHPPHPTPKTKDKTTTMISNALAIAGFVVLIVIVIWGLWHVGGLFKNWFAPYFKPGTAALTVTAPERAASRQPAQINWNHRAASEGRYAFLYECAEGIAYGVPVLRTGETRASLMEVECGTAFTLGQATSSVIVVPILTGDDEKTANISILFVPTSGGQVRGSAKMIITPGGATTPETPETPETPNTPQAQTHNTGPADLVITVLSAVTDITGASVVTFDIANRGGSSSGTYAFTANLPTMQAYTFISDPQASLAPGAHIVNTLRFNQTVSGLFSVSVDPSNTVRESNETNNNASHQVTMPYPTYQY